MHSFDKQGIPFGIAEIIIYLIWNLQIRSKNRRHGYTLSDNGKSPPPFLGWFRKQLQDFCNISQSLLNCGSNMNYSVGPTMYTTHWGRWLVFICCDTVNIDGCSRLDDVKFLWLYPLKEQRSCVPPMQTIIVIFKIRLIA